MEIQQKFHGQAVFECLEINFTEISILYSSE